MKVWNFVTIPFAQALADKKPNTRFSFSLQVKVYRGELLSIYSKYYTEVSHSAFTITAISKFV